MIRKPLTAFTICSLLLISACSTNEATGRQQFTGLMSTSQEQQIGAEEQAKVQKAFGVYENQKVQAYVDGICSRLLPGIERKDVNYTCTVLDSDVINAFALPGGYININRGLIAAANDEAEVASVLAHEMGHVTGRHISERYSKSALTGLGATALSIGLGSSAANQLFGLGANLYLSSYSRSQETESDDLGIRYLNRAGYEPAAMARFLSNLQRNDQLAAAESGTEKKEMQSFFSTHPLTANRVARATEMAASYPTKGTRVARSTHQNVISGMVYGSSPKEGFIKGSEFVHPSLGFGFHVPPNFNFKNTPSKIITQTRGKSGAGFIFDGAGKPRNMTPENFISTVWMKGKKGLENMQTITVNGMRGATAQLEGRVEGQPALIRMVAIEWSPTEVYRFQFAMPQATTDAEIAAFKKVTYSLRRLSENEKKGANPKRVAFVTAGSGDSVGSLSRRMAFNDGLNELRFRVINGMDQNTPIQTGRKYKVIVQ